MTSRRLEGRRLLVIGGGQQTYAQQDPPVGIGRAICQLAARQGARVVVADRDRDAARSTVDAITAEHGAAYPIIADASDPDAAAAMFTSAVEVLGGLDALAVNTGITAGQGFAGTSVADWDRVMAVNVRSHFLAVRHASELMAPGGSITLTSSTACRAVRTTDTPAYATSKAALEGLCAQAAKDLAPRSIRINIVMPGLIDTSLGRLASAVFPERDDISIPLGHRGSGWDIAHAVTFLLSHDARYITNIVLPVDGGLSSIH